MSRAPVPFLDVPPEAPPVMSLNENTVRAAIQTVIDPNTGKDFVTGK